MKKRLLSLVLAIVMVMGIAIPASAAIDPGSAKWGDNFYWADGVSYYFVGGDATDFSVEKDLYKAILTAYPTGSWYDHNYCDANLAEMWLRLAVWINKFHSRSSGPEEPLLKAVYDEDGPMDLMNPGEWEAYMSLENWYDVYTTGLQFKDSLKDADETMCKFANWTKRKHSSENENFRPSGLGVSQEEYTRTQPVAYIAIRSSKSNGSYQKGHGAGCGLVFYDFKLVPVLPDQNDPSSNFSFVNDGPASVTSMVSPTMVVNNTALSQVSGSVSYQDNYEVTTSTSFSKSNEFSYGTAIEVGTEWGSKIGPVTASASFSVETSMSQAVSNTWSQGKDVSKGQSQEYTSAVTLDPYSRANLNIEKTVQPAKMSFTTPMSLSYKVAMMDLSMDITNDSGTYTSVTANFPDGHISGEPDDARSSLIYRYYDNRDYETKLRWNDMDNYSNGFEYQGQDGSLSRVCRAIRDEVPSLRHAEEMKTTFTTITARVGNATALYPLTTIQPTKTQSIQLNKGGSMYPDDIAIEGLNKYNAPFSGFDAKKGYWIICDQNGNPVSSDVANITLEPGTGRQKLSAGRNDGTAYIKFMIDEDYYKDDHIYNGDRFSNNSINSKPIPVTVIQKNFRDVHTYDFFYEPVYWAVEKGITDGTSPTTFSPKEDCTREQVATFLWRYEGKPAPRGNNPFRDVYAGHYAYAPIVWAAENGIANGLTATTFGPKEEVTRAQFVTMLWRLAGEPQPKSMKSPFKDVNANSWYG